MSSTFKSLSSPFVSFETETNLKGPYKGGWNYTGMWLAMLKGDQKSSFESLCRFHGYRLTEN